MTPKPSLWYKYKDNDSVRLRVNKFQVSSVLEIKNEIINKSNLAVGNFTLRVKGTTDTEYKELNDTLLNNCGNNYVTLIDTFEIKKQNPIIIEDSASSSTTAITASLSNIDFDTPQGSASGSTTSTPQDQEIWVHYNNRSVNFTKVILGGMKINNVKKLIDVIKMMFDEDIEKVSEKIITLRRGEEEDLGLETLISELYNTKESALQIIVENQATIIVKTFKNDKFYFDNQRIRSVDEVCELIKGMEELKLIISEETIFLGEDRKVLSRQHLESAQQSGFLNITLSVPIGSEMHKKNQENLKKAFNIEYVDRNEMIKNFKLYLNGKHKTWKNNTNLYAPYCTIFQSSGYGKSRLIKEVAKVIPTIYLCLRDAKSTGYPPRTHIGADLFERVLGDLKEGEEWRFLYVLQTIIQCFQAELENCVNSGDLWDNQMDVSFCEKIWNKVQSKSANWKSIVHDDVNNLNTFIDNSNTNDVHFLLCIDEARALLSPINNKISPFRLFRRALRKIKWNGFFTLLLDTLSKISNFVLPQSMDPSHRDTEDLSLELFHPYFRLTTMDVFNNVKNCDYKDERWNLAKYGRPLHMSYLLGCTDEYQPINKLMNLLKRKLLGGASSFNDSRKEITSLAILSSLVGLDISPQSQLASELVASHMATCLSVSEDRERLIVVYPSEPLLSEAALELMSSSILPQILNQFNSLLRKGFVEPGPRGEIIGRIILILAAQRLRLQKAESSIEEFLKELYNNKSLPPLYNISQQLLNGTVAFTHFNAIDYTPTKKNLKQFYMRRCTFIMKRNHPGADICIPVKLETGEYSMIIIQIKNINTTSTKGDKKCPASTRSMLNFNYVFSGSDLADHDKPFLSLYWQLGFQGSYQEVPHNIETRSYVEETENHSLCYATFGFDHFKMDEEIDIILQDILDSHISPFLPEWKVNDESKGDIWNEDELKIMQPLG